MLQTVTKLNIGFNLLPPATVVAEGNVFTSLSAVADPGFSKWGGRCFVANGGAHILFSGKKCMKLKEIGLKWGGARLLAPCYSKITIFL